MASNLYQRTQEGVIRTLLAQPNQFSEVSRYIAPEDFNDENYKLIYKAIQALCHESKEVSLPLIVTWIRDEEPEIHIDPQSIFSLGQNSTKWVAEATPTDWAKLLKAESNRFKSIHEIQESLNKITKEDPMTVIQQLKAQLQEIEIAGVINSDETFIDKVDHYLDNVDKRHETTENIIPTPYPTLDKHVIGWLPEQLITIGARTSVGKSVVATQSAITACTAGKSVAMFSLEMSDQEVMDRMIASIGKVNLKNIKSNPLTKDERERLLQAAETLKTFNFEIDDKADVTIDYITSKALRLAQRPEGLDFIIIDYLQLITTVGNKNNRQEAVAEISRAMKKLAKQLKIPIMILVQLNRADKNEEDDRLPKIDDIRESGAIAQDSDTILLIHRKLNAEEIDPKALFIIGKNRNGSTGRMISVRCSLEFASFDDNVNDDEFNNNEVTEEIEQNDTGFGGVSVDSIEVMDEEENIFNSDEDDYSSIPFELDDEEDF